MELEGDAGGVCGLHLACLPLAVKCTLLMVNTPNLSIPINLTTEPVNSILQVYEHNEEE